MADPRMNNLLKWSIENSGVTLSDPNAPKSGASLDHEALQQLLSGMTGPSDAEMMLKKMSIVMDTDFSLEDRVSAFDDFEMLIENLDNANNMENLGLWTKLVDQLEQEHAELRKYAAWCVGTAVENNVKAQERVRFALFWSSWTMANVCQLLVVGAIPKLVKLATEDPSLDVRKKAVRALSCASRNHQPSLDAVVEHVPSQFKPGKSLDAGDMEHVDSVINKLKAEAEQVR